MVPLTLAVVVHPMWRGIPPETAWLNTQAGAPSVPAAWASLSVGGQRIPRDAVTSRQPELWGQEGLARTMPQTHGVMSEQGQHQQGC